MQIPASQRVPLFAGDQFQATLLTPADADTLQQFFQDNPDYFLMVSGEVARQDTAQKQLAGDIPAEFSYTKQMALGFFDDQQRMLAMADVVSDLLAPGVWHIGLYMLASSERSRGLGGTLYQALERWIESQDAQWIRLGVVIGNSVAESFWIKQGFRDVSVRHAVAMQRKVNDVRVMVKPLGENLLSEYLARVQRDQPAPPDS